MVSCVPATTCPCHEELSIFTHSLTISAALVQAIENFQRIGCHFCCCFSVFYQPSPQPARLRPAELVIKSQPDFTTIRHDMDANVSRPARAGKAPWRRNDRMSAEGREVLDGLPIFHLSSDDVFRIIRDAGQSPHWIYDHVSRCSCSFCIFGSRADLRRAAEPRPGRRSVRPPDSNYRLSAVCSAWS